MSDLELSDRIKQIKARLGAATPGPWGVFEHGDRSGLEAGPPCTEENLKGWVNDVCRITGGRRGVTKQQRDDISFIANAPADIEFLLAELDRLMIENKGLNDSLVISLADSLDKEISGDWGS